MDFADERYVRIYTRDTATWKLIGFEGQATLCLVLRKCARKGVFELGGKEPAAAASLVADIPLPFAQKGMAAILEQGVAVVRGDTLHFPRFVAAQESAKSAAMRQREKRERDRQRELDVDDDDNDDDLSQIASDSDRCHECHAPRHDSHAERHIPAQHSTAQLGSSSDPEDRSLTGSDLREEPEPPGRVILFRPPVGEPPPEAEPFELTLAEQIITAHAKEYGSRQVGARPMADYRSAEKVARWCVQNSGPYKLTPLTLGLRVVSGLFAHYRASERMWPLSWTANNPAEFAEPPPGAKMPTKPIKGCDEPLAPSRYRDLTNYSLGGSK